MCNDIFHFYNSYIVNAHKEKCVSVKVVVYSRPWLETPSTNWCKNLDLNLSAQGTIIDY